MVPQMSADVVIYTVSRLNREVRELLLGSFPLLRVEGEISNLVRARSGHFYFTLKDEHAQIRCAMFRSRNLLLDFDPEDGMHVVVRARASLYEARGEFQLGIEHMEPLGSGALHRKFEALKRRLAAEGLFDTAHKRALPAFARCVGVVTSPRGAAIQDVLSVLQRRFPALPVLVFPTPVQGSGTAEGIVAALRAAEQGGECDVILLTRGGGSIEDLWSFNEERVARAIHACTVPVLSAVGHEVDFTIADFVADQRAPTPSAAAEMVSPDAGEILARLARFRDRLGDSVFERLDRHREALGQFLGRLRREHPEARLQQHALRLDELERRLDRSVRSTLRHRAEMLARGHARLAAVSPAHRLGLSGEVLLGFSRRLQQQIRRRIETLDAELRRKRQTLLALGPERILARGYAIVESAGGSVVRGHGDLHDNREVTIRLHRERMDARITGWKRIKEPGTD